MKNFKFSFHLLIAFAFYPTQLVVGTPSANAETQCTAVASKDTTAVARDEGMMISACEYRSDCKLLKDTLTKTIQTSNPSIWSRWNTIGTYSKTLLTYKNDLPPQRDSLYELALAVKENKPIQKWIDAEKVTVESSVREVRALRENRKSTKGKISKTAKNYAAVATLCFRSYDEAAETLLSTITNSNNFEVRSPKAFREAIKSKVGIDGFEKIKNRFKD